ncbi:Family 16 glycosylhydrolase [Rhodovastum atsumiense]|uniref:Family 16 glycosylhydrolase n=1 Tax=Rhodovastum atsumiense TaxID=504468 RepID=A0A5M6IYT8_9PROT|nr:family 16 glycosylhydrolase [Rhodovastum atsumiense]KAA5613451.1 family 16 glycosylhydrolase [Rhodovastum atsumiense]CAH2603186.1 Family 16 glycosylhydrolase [Rhodovastum atsumiense]
MSVQSSQVAITSGAGWRTDFTRSLAPVGHSWGHVWDDTAHGQVIVSSWVGDGFRPSGIMQAPAGTASAQGYGCYEVEVQFHAAIPGGFVCLWPASNAWPGPELDFVEVGGDGTAYSTVHWKGVDGGDRTAVHRLGGVDVTQRHVYELDWRQDLLVMKVDGREMWRSSDHVPADAAHGGENGALGAGVQPAGFSSLQHGDNFITVSGMRYQPWG